MSRESVRVCEFCARAFAKDQVCRIYIIAKDSKGRVKRTETIGLMDLECMEILAEFIKSVKAEIVEGVPKPHEKWEEIVKSVRSEQQQP